MWHRRPRPHKKLNLDPGFVFLTDLVLIYCDCIHLLLCWVTFWHCQDLTFPFYLISNFLHVKENNTLPFFADDNNGQASLAAVTLHRLWMLLGGVAPFIICPKITNRLYIFMTRRPPSCRSCTPVNQSSTIDPPAHPSDVRCEISVCRQ